MDDTTLSILIAAGVAAGVALGITLSIIVVYVIHYRYRKSLLAGAEQEIERRKHILNLDDTMNQVVTPMDERDHKTEWNREHNVAFQVSLEKQKLYEDELRNLEQPKLSDAIDAASKSIKK